ncbi:MAG: hypothetical protein GC185_00455 [Alphaproteobacteria bacterium]|nr:hypothetical protein [Alphaproteobacteria bacterium]
MDVKPAKNPGTLYILTKANENCMTFSGKPLFTGRNMPLCSMAAGHIIIHNIELTAAGGKCLTRRVIMSSMAALC